MGLFYLLIVLIAVSGTQVLRHAIKMHAAVNEPPHGIAAVLEPTLDRATGTRCSTHQVCNLPQLHTRQA
jgi:hypothetical protein